MEFPELCASTDELETERIVSDIYNTTRPLLARMPTKELENETSENIIQSPPSHPVSNSTPSQAELCVARVAQQRCESNQPPETLPQSYVTSLQSFSINVDLKSAVVLDVFVMSYSAR